MARAQKMRCQVGTTALVMFIVFQPMNLGGHLSHQGMMNAADWWRNPKSNDVTRHIFGLLYRWYTKSKDLPTCQLHISPLSPHPRSLQNTDRNFHPESFGMMDAEKARFKATPGYHQPGLMIQDTDSIEH